MKSETVKTIFMVIVSIILFSVIIAALKGPKVVAFLDVTLVTFDQRFFHSLVIVIAVIAYFATLIFMLALVSWIVNYVRNE